MCVASIRYLVDMSKLVFKVMDDVTGENVGRAELPSSLLARVHDTPVDGYFAVLAPSGKKIAEMQVIAFAYFSRV